VAPFGADFAASASASASMASRDARDMSLPPWITARIDVVLWMSLSGLRSSFARRVAACPRDVSERLFLRQTIITQTPNRDTSNRDSARPFWLKDPTSVALHTESDCDPTGVDTTGRSHSPNQCDAELAYAMLIAQTQIRLIVEGYDPTIGVMHEKKALRGTHPGFALDHMEPMRPVVDRAVLQLIETVTFTGADFSIQHDGICRMNPELARRVAQLALERCEVSNK